MHHPDDACDMFCQEVHNLPERPALADGIDNEIGSRDTVCRLRIMLLYQHINLHIGIDKETDYRVIIKPLSLDTKF